MDGCDFHKKYFFAQGERTRTWMGVREESMENGLQRAKIISHAKT